MDDRYQNALKGITTLPSVLCNECTEVFLHRIQSVKFSTIARIMLYILVHAVTILCSE